MNKALILIAALLLGGCEQVIPEKWEPDQELRAKLFASCMKSLPAGPQETKYNDWDEVVNACNEVSYLQSLRIVK